MTFNPSDLIHVPTFRRPGPGPGGPVDSGYAQGYDDPHSRFSYTTGETGGIVNPPFDPRRYSTNPYYAGLEQGFLLRNEDVNGADSSSGGSTSSSNAQGQSVAPLVRLRFLYNPSDFQVTYTPSDQLPPDVTNAQAGYGPNSSAAQIIGASSTSCSFNLLFDRTYEVSNSAGAGLNAQFANASGVNVDVNTFKQLVGVPVDADGFDNGLPLYAPAKLYLGGRNSIRFYGVITGATVTYSHFSTAMVPMRAAISISMKQYIKGDSTSTPSAGSTNSTTTPNSGTGTVSPKVGGPFGQLIPSGGSSNGKVTKPIFGGPFAHPFP